MNEERLNPFIPGEADENDMFHPETNKEANNKEPVERLVPFIADGTKTPDQKIYLLLLTFLETEDNEKNDQSWMFVYGRLEARYKIMQYIKDGILDVFKSYIAVEDSPLTDDLPTVYSLFTDPRSSWSRSADFGDDFNIDDYEYILDIAPVEDNEKVEAEQVNNYELGVINTAINSGSDLIHHDEETLPDGEDV